MGEQIENGTFQLNNTRNQYFAAIIANLVMLGYGSVISWITPALVRLSSHETTPLVSGGLNDDEISWIVSISSIAALIGAISFGYIISTFGSKRTVLFLAVPNIVFWLLIYFGKSFYTVFISRCISGWTGGGIYAALGIYASEIANDDIRGRISSITMVAWNIGSLFAFIIGAKVQYEVIPIICVFIPIVFAVIFVFIPNVPRFYLQRGQTKKAEDALKFFKGFTGKDPREIEAINKEMERLKCIIKEQNNAEKLKLSDFCNHTAIKGLITGIGLMALLQCTLHFTLITYAVLIFSRTGTHILDPHSSSIVLAVALLIGSLVSTYFVDILGRKISIILSVSGCVLGLSTMGLYQFLHVHNCDLSSFTWVPVVSLSFVIFMSSSGIMPLSTVCGIENLPTKIRNAGMAMFGFAANIFLFTILKIFLFLLDLINVHGVMWLFSCLCILGLILVSIGLKETSKQCLDNVGDDDDIKKMDPSQTKL